jgi:hypothetical protein
MQYTLGLSIQSEDGYPVAAGEPGATGFQFLLDMPEGRILPKLLGYGWALGLLGRGRSAIL